jgi:hypothetical protein
MASSAPAVVAATDFLMILLSPKRQLEKEKREVSRTREAQALLSSHCNMNYNIQPVAHSHTLGVCTGEQGSLRALLSHARFSTCVVFYLSILSANGYRDQHVVASPSAIG